MYSLLCANYANHLSNSLLRKMVVFSSPLPTNAAYCVAEMYIQTALNGKIFPRCWLHSGPRKMYSSQLVSVRNKSYDRKVCSCPNTQSLLASKMINQLVWETKRQRHFFTRPVKLLHIFYVGLCIILFIQPVPFLCIFLLLVVFKLGLHYPFLLHWNCSAVKRL